MDYEKITALMREFENSALNRLSVEIDGVKVKMAKNPPIHTSVRSSGGGKAIIPDSLDEPITLIPQVKNSLAPGEIVRSPIVGTFYEGASPGAPPFAKLNGKVSEGDVLCIVEAMKVMNEITSKVSGTVAEIYVKNEQAVEFNQPLFRII